MNSLQLLPIVGLAISLTPSATAQKILHTVIGNQAQLRLGAVLAGAGDVNNDGFDDCIAGTVNQNSASGGVWIYSGLDGSLLHNVIGAPSQALGNSICGVGDINGDGFGDFAAGAEQAGLVSGGQVQVFSGADGSVLLDLSSATSGDMFGSAVCGLEDLTGDGIPEFAVGAERSNTSGLTTGEVTIHSGADGSILRNFYGDGQQDSFGVSLGTVPDMDGDGLQDLIVGADRDDNNGPSSGMARAVNPATGAVLWSADGDVAGNEFGFSVAGIPDVNGDGRGDVIVDPRDGDYCRIFSGINGAVLHDLVGPPVSLYGRNVAGVSDVDGDGFGDVVVTELTFNSGRGGVHLVSGATGATIFTTAGETSQVSYGSWVASIGDANADGTGDWVIGASGVDLGAANGGKLEMIAGAQLLGDRYCSPANPNSTGGPARIRALGSATVSNQCLTLIIDGFANLQFAYFLASQTQGNAMPPLSQGVLCLGGNIARFNRPNEVVVGPIGELDVDMMAVPANPNVAILPGETWNFQAWYRDQNPAPTNNFTDAVSIMFQ